MKIRISINGTKHLIAQVTGKGHLGTHINLDDKKGTGIPQVDIITSGWDTNESTVTKYSDWPRKELFVGDQMLINILSDDSNQRDEPERWSLSSDEGRTMIESPEIADHILNIAYNYNRELNQLLIDLKDKLAETDLKQLKRAVGYLLVENSERLIYPIYRKHPDKVPEEMKDMPL